MKHGSLKTELDRDTAEAVGFHLKNVVQSALFFWTQTSIAQLIRANLEAAYARQACQPALGHAEGYPISPEKFRSSC